MPDRPEDGLFICSHKISPHEEHKQVAVLPDFFEPEVKEGSFGFNDQIPVIRLRGEGFGFQGSRFPFLKVFV